ncbi:MAG: conserved predicted rane protein [Caulobacteraceae bacterium]|nr:conserved predicted rane protein [Caulobacteraceae bacterium]
MSSVSQTNPRQRWSFRRWFVISMGVVALILAVAMAPVGDRMMRAAEAAHLHAPDLAVFARLTPAMKVHLVTALAALSLGAVLMLNRKGRIFHRTAGWMWVVLVATVAGSSIFITSLNHGRWSLLHLFTGWTLLVLPLAVIWARRHDVARHRRTMMGLFYGGFALNLLIAFIPGRALWDMMFG